MGLPKFCRLHWERISTKTGQPQGIFAAIWLVEQSGAFSVEEVRRINEIRAWFKSNVPDPPFYEEGNPKGLVTWFKVDALTCLNLARELAAILKQHRHRIEESFSDAPGTIVYEDAYQVGVLSDDLK